MPASCRLVHPALGRTSFDHQNGALPVIAVTSVHLDVCKNASVILNLLRWRNAIVFMDPAGAANGVASEAVGRPRNASGQQGVKPYNFPKLLLLVGLRGNNETGQIDPRPTASIEAQVTKWLTCLT